ncbi:MAG: pantoate--beta-alanine ligase [Deltaproteobacteria bacterium RIFCSPLOWO2_12_FULL_60_19]|nr:MAG: pantoate--beta-alanine ligase [Deltaproteobacteria bacterium RIFCSPLOWO2_12_FULL_60_19]
MRIIEHIEEMRSWSETERRAGRRIVLVPTMGSLHGGHLSLVRDGKRRGDRLVVSLFVNPTQFGPQEDYASYPRDFERDRGLLEREGTDVMFSPSAGEMYPAGHQSYVEVGKLGEQLCGVFRPGHFRGVATVVAKLFNIAQPHAAIFGEKDYQQLQVIRRMARDLNLGVEVVGHPTVRAPDGLALSSRNSYLSDAERQAALSLCRALNKAEALALAGEKESGRILDAARAEIEKEPLARIQYAKLCHPETLEDVEKIESEAVLALAVFVGKTRLIDNTVLKA